MLKDSAEKSGTRIVYVHRRSMNGETARRVMDAVRSCGLEAVTSVEDVKK
jgi:hypothetical protein